MVEITVDKHSSVPVYKQISQLIEHMISQGEMAEGFRLPPDRKLAKTLGVNRTTVLNAYRDLKEAGLVSGHVGRGTTVLPRAAVALPASGVQPLRWTQLVRQRTSTPWEGVIRDLHALTETSDIIILSMGLPALELIPTRLIGDTLAAVVSDRGPEVFTSGPSEGAFGFRTALAGWMGRRGAPCEPDQILVTTGSQQAIDLIARVFLEPGDTVVVEEPSYFGAISVLQDYQARLVSVPTDRDGLRMDLLESALQRYRPKFLYTLATYQNPSGVLLSLERRRQLLDLVHRYSVPVVEDDIYRDLSYAEEPPPPLQGLDDSGFVIHVSSFSKVLCPGLRIGWVAAPAPVIQQLVRAKQLTDLHAPTISQLVIERLLTAGAIAEHARTLREAYLRRRDLMAEALRAEAPEGISWAKPNGGFYFWCRLPEIAHAVLLAAAAEEKVSYLPGRSCYVHEPPEHRVRLSFSHCPEGQIQEGIVRLMRAVRRAIRAAAPKRGRAETRCVV
jgi:DNA-binding transcriptional MocR family regulator